ncbi:MAG: MBL fold metallo-hydrolase [Clostridia bacterium]|nr:MBL fold metallo-hydrolase [Clostridia bacterium]
MLISHHAHSEFLLETADGCRILTDPFDAHTGYPMREVACDVITVSHGHGDHSFIQKAPNATAVLDRPGHFTPAAGVHAEGIPCWHDDRQGALRGPNIIYIIEAEGLRVAHLGDLGAWDEELVSRLVDIDVLLLPVGGHFTIDAQSAAALAARVKPRLIIPMHYRTEFNASWPIAPLADCLPAFGAENAPRMPLLRVTSQDLSQQPRVAVLLDRVDG